MASPIIVDFPLKGEWITPNTPGTKVPSHGTDMLGQRYAYDFVGLEPGSQNTRFYRHTTLRYLLLGVCLKDCYGWGRPVYAASEGTVIRATDGWPERNPVHLVRDLFNMLKNSFTINVNQEADLRILTGNHIITENSDGYTLYAHLQQGSICVSAGDKIIPGQRLASVGHSGNSTAPHLHFQMMDNLDPWKAKGLPCCFREFDIQDDGVWHTVQNSMPRATDRIQRL
ncbi:MAG: M23 family metallopeptidase [Leptolinea sp.]|nr:M23 family metallopeptidase [Leptolinea sp.]